MNIKDKENFLDLINTIKTKDIVCNRNKTIGIEFEIDGKKYEYTADGYSTPTSSSIKIKEPKELTIDDIEKIEKLNIWGDYTSIPKEIFELPNLKILEINTYNIKTIRKSIKKLKNLEELYLGSLVKIKTLPKEIFELPNLKKLALEFLESLTEIPSEFSKIELESITIREINDKCNIPPINSKSLKYVYLVANINSFKSLNSFTKGKNLEEIYISTYGIPEKEILVSINSNKLKSVFLDTGKIKLLNPYIFNKNKNLEELRIFLSPDVIDSLELNNIPNLKYISITVKDIEFNSFNDEEKQKYFLNKISFTNLPLLEELRLIVKDCIIFTDIIELKNLNSIKEIYLYIEDLYTTSEFALSNISFPTLEDFYIISPNLAFPKEFEELNLKSLYIHIAANYKSFSLINFAKNKNLESFSLGLDRENSLILDNKNYLDFKNINSFSVYNIILKQIPKCFNPNMKSFSYTPYEKPNKKSYIKEINVEGLGFFENLKENENNSNPIEVTIEISNSNIEKIDLSGTDRIEDLMLNNNKLKELPKGLDNQKNLTNLNLYNNNIKEISENLKLENLKNLIKLNLCCNDIKEIPENLKWENLKKLSEICIINQKGGNISKPKKLKELIKKLRNINCLKERREWCE